jgi:hypothetical protein
MAKPEWMTLSENEIRDKVSKKVGNYYLNTELLQMVGELYQMKVLKYLSSYCVAESNFSVSHNEINQLIKILNQSSSYNE